jgi:nucleoside-diphosphate-sugar epimerase
MSGLVGGYIVLQLLERGQPPSSIRIVDLRPPNRADMLQGPATQVDFVQTDVSSAEATDKAFSKPWHPSVAHLPLTVFHTAAVIVPSDRSKLVSGFCEAVNVRGTQNVVDAARRAGADVLVSTTSASISIRPIELWVPPWRLWSRGSPRNFWQVLDEQDFFEPLRAHDEFYANYPASKAAAERIVCAENSKGLRTGCIRPANGVYGNPTDNTVGGALAKSVFPT